MAADMSANASCGDSARSALDPDALRRGVLDNLICLQARPPAIATPHDWYMALSYSVRDRMLARWAATIQTYAARELRVACYLSAEFLIGPQLGNNLVNLGIEAEARAAMQSRSWHSPWNSSGSSTWYFASSRSIRGSISVALSREAMGVTRPSSFSYSTAACAKYAISAGPPIYASVGNQ